MSDTTTDQAKPPAKKPPAKGVVTYRADEGHKDAARQLAAWQGYGDKYTLWIRDLVEAEIRNPKHRPTPKPREKK